MLPISGLILDTLSQVLKGAEIDSAFQLASPALRKKFPSPRVYVPGPSYVTPRKHWMVGRTRTYVSAQLLRGSLAIFWGTCIHVSRVRSGCTQGAGPGKPSWRGITHITCLAVLWALTDPHTCTMPVSP